MAAVPGERPPLPPLHGAPLALLTIAIAFATFMEVLDITIVNVSVPHIAGSLGVSPQEGTWAISSYSLASAIMQPLRGWVGRRFRPDGRAVAEPPAQQLSEREKGSRPRTVGDDRRRRTDLRADPWRLADRQLFVAVDLLHQHAGRRARGDHHLDPVASS